ncbi:Arylsulfatase [Roseimaritima multifibrata]|uniref:Arylsulfatase n=1 Tax=Roseimaritima multifibrata TaxID=1930274 RepID=A0A517MFP7_9BACT|nr:arylsulfatase [Roseimaritima multifibrata]QDS93719.1 Arylsulfatase [Roseimaritima multifibrata]
MLPFAISLPRRLLTLGLLALTVSSSFADDRTPPNVLLVMVDDLGFSDLGCYGSEIETPHLDRLANAGIRYTQFYNTGRCWPTRASLLTGFYPHAVRRDQVPGIKSGGRGQRPEWGKLLPSYLSQAGYRSYHSGKWHLDGKPLQTGFDRSYYLQDQGRFFSPQTHFKDDVKLPAIPRDSGFYGTTAIADHAIECLQEHAEEHVDAPFFHYVAFTAPHFPLHALPEDIAKYEGRYDEGWEVVRAERWKRIQALGLVNAPISDVERQLGPPYPFPDAIEQLGPGEINRPVPWDDLTAEQKQFQATKMTLHAAMIDRVDQELGRIFAQLREMNAWENTLILFLSDNGASAEIMVRNDGHDPQAAPGSAASYLCLGPGWSTVSNTPFRRHKTLVHEGGISTPLIVHWPARIKADDPLRHDVAHVVDISPTILDVAGVPLPSEIPMPLPGRSLQASFSADQNPSLTRWWLHEGNRAIRIGDWKLVASSGEAWELYDLAKDRAETNDLAKQDPQRVSEMADKWERLWQQQQAAAQ